MKAFLDLKKVPENGVIAFIEGNVLRMFFDFEKEEPKASVDGEKGGQVSDDAYSCQNVDLVGRADYGSVVSAIVNDRFPADKVDAIRWNYELAKDEKSGITEAKRTEYLGEYDVLQAWRTLAKAIAKEVLLIIG